MNRRVGKPQRNCFYCGRKFVPDPRIGKRHRYCHKPECRRASRATSRANWLARPENARITLHFTPTSCSWLNMVEIFFGIITRQAIRRGTFTSVKELTVAIGTFIDHWNDHPRPFTWTKDADEILRKINRAKTKTNSLTHH